MQAQLDIPGERAGPVIILSYLYSGAQSVQASLAERTNLARTVGTGILPMCEMAAAAWARIANHPGETMSQLAISSIRTLVNTQLTIILAGAGGRRWCELVIAPVSTARTFLQIVPSARFICVYRACQEVISAAITAHPWGLDDPATAHFVALYPGNSVAAIAGYWASATERLLAFEAAYPQFTARVRYEDVVADRHGLDKVRSALGLHEQAGLGLSPKLPGQDAPADAGRHGERLQVPTEMIPDELRTRIDELHARLNYPASFHESGL
jgi:protein-tyrosine sulfotransferase